MPRITEAKPYRGLPMEGWIARWYARQRRSAPQARRVRRQARELAADLRDGAQVLEVAPGPGFLAIELARGGRLQVTGLDVSKTFVELAARAAREAGVDAQFRLGDVANMPFPADSFDFVVNQAAFKNFSRPAQALEEIHRVLRPGGTAIIQDMNRDASASDIADEVNDMALGWVSTAMTKIILGRLRHGAYTREEFQQLAIASPFRGCELRIAFTSMEMRLSKSLVN